MTYPGKLFIAEVAGPPGTMDEVGAWCRSVVEKLPGIQGIDRTGRYRKLNDVRALVAADVVDDGALVPLAKSFSSPPSAFSVTTAVATQQAEQHRADARGDSRACPLFYTIGLPVPAESAAELGQWYDVEHIPMLQRCSYWIMTRRFHVERSAIQYWGAHLVIHYLSDIRAFCSPERDAARQTAWRDRLVAQPWFQGKFSIWLQERN